MNGYRWQPFFRITPADGDQVLIDLSNDLQRIPGAGPASVSVKYQIDQKKREDVNGNSCHLTRGFRGEVAIELEDGGEMLDSDIVARVVNALRDSSSRVELSLDGMTWREVQITKLEGPTPNKGKPAAGCRWNLTVQTVELIREITPLGSGCW